MPAMRQPCWSTAKDNCAVRVSQALAILHLSVLAILLTLSPIMHQLSDLQRL